MPTPKQLKAAELLSENIRKPKPDPIGKVIRKAGYSEEVSKKPKLVTQSLGFKQVLEKAGITDDKLAKVMDEGLSAMKVVTSHTEPDKEFPDHPTRHKFLETAVKLKGHTVQDQPQGNSYTFIKVSNDDREEFDL